MGDEQTTRLWENRGMGTLRPSERPKPFLKKAIESDSPICPYCGRQGTSVRVSGDREDSWIGTSCEDRWAEADLQEPLPPKLNWLYDSWKWIGKHWRWDALLSIGAFGMIKLNEYGVAIALLVVAGIAASSKLSQWEGLEESSRLTKPLRVAGYILVIAALVLLTLAINTNRGTAPWSTLSSFGSVSTVSAPVTTDQVLDQASIDFGRINFGSTLDKPVHEVAEVHYKNHGKRTASDFIHVGGLVFNKTILTDEAVAYHQNALLAALLNKTDGANRRSTVSPDVPENFIRIPEEPSAGSDRLSEERLNILSGKMYLYVLVAMKYRDDAMPKNVIKITEGCWRFSGNVSISVECGRNASTFKTLTSNH